VKNNNRKTLPEFFVVEMHVLLLATKILVSVILGLCAG
jgi:hypothetical protein